MANKRYSDYKNMNYEDKSLGGMIWKQKFAVKLH